MRPAFTHLETYKTYLFTNLETYRTYKPRNLHLKASQLDGPKGTSGLGIGALLDSQLESKPWWTFTWNRTLLGFYLESDLAGRRAWAYVAAQDNSSYAGH